MLKSFKERIRELKKTQEYCREQAKQEFVSGLTRILRSKGISNASYAEKLDTSAAYVTKVLRGDGNVTIDSMVKLTHAIGARIHIHVADNEMDVRWFEHLASTSIEQHAHIQSSRKKIEVDVSSLFERFLPGQEAA